MDTEKEIRVGERAWMRGADILAPARALPQGIETV